MNAPRHMRYYVCGQSTWRKTLQKAANLGTIELSPYFIGLGEYGAETQARPARTH